MPARPAGFCQVTVGELEVTFVPDGEIRMTPAVSYPGSASDLWATNPHLLDADGRLVMSLGALLVRGAGPVVLVDLGWGPTRAPIGGGDGGAPGGLISGGALLENLGRCGVAPGDVDAVLLSHLHGDHTGWIVDPAATEAAPCFPRATHYLHADEWTYWTGPSTTGPGPTPAQLSILATRAELVGDGDIPVAGVTVRATPGHTPGHCSFVLSSGTDRAVVLGDAVHCPLELSAPELAFVADVDPVLARRTRSRLARELAEPGTLTAGPHFADLVFGRLLPGEGAASWQFPASQAYTPPG